MTLIPNWKQILTRAWSVWISVMAALFAGAEAALSVLTADHLGIPQGTFAALAAFASAGAMLARLLQQPALHQEPDQ